MKDSSLGPFTIIKLIGKNAMEVILTEEFSRKHPVFPVSLAKPYFHTKEDKFPSKENTTTPPDIVKVEGLPGLVKKFLKARKIRLNGKDQRWYLVRFKNQTTDKDSWLAEAAISIGNLHLRRFRGSRKIQKSHQDEPFFVGRVYQAVTQNHRTSMTAKYHKPMVKLKYHHSMQLSQISSKGIKRKMKLAYF
ncbi:hypothetical protein O181_032080 [Austropuccinia psidii MF-1]|uniref:Chromo domain-containing protein n=1 Tax=Austropuccinia psidii MF-1 TaxID=1389203 RepID=A0A9Q3D0D0_9BASI|nr:hypothetical protein [Austropuccinia psidii MF-1]